MRMLADYILIKPETGKEQKIGLIVLPDSMDVKRKWGRGTVEGVGPGLFLQNGEQMTPDVKPGDKVLYFKEHAIGILVDQRDRHIVQERQVISIFEEGDADASGYDPETEEKSKTHPGRRTE